MGRLTPTTAFYALDAPTFLPFVLQTAFKKLKDELCSLILIINEKGTVKFEIKIRNKNRVMLEIIDL